MPLFSLPKISFVVFNPDLGCECTQRIKLAGTFLMYLNINLKEKLTPVIFNQGAAAPWGAVKPF